MVSFNLFHLLKRDDGCSQIRLQVETVPIG